MDKLTKMEKIKSLFLIIEKEREVKKASLNSAIEQAAISLNLKKESARNYYYKSLKFLRQNPIVASNLGIDLKKFDKKSFEKFDKERKEHIYSVISKNLENGISVRQSCMELANNDATKMLRYQNKYRNMKKQFENVSNQVKKKQDKVINITKAKSDLNKKISDDEINALFMGLIRIIKKAAIDNVSSELKSECEFATQNFRQTIIDLNQKEIELKKVWKENEELNLKIESQKKQICLLLEKLSQRKLSKLEKKSEEKCLKLKSFSKKDKNDNIL